jgi:hypothetical protein
MNLLNALKRELLSVFPAFEEYRIHVGQNLRFRHPTNRVVIIAKINLHKPATISTFWVPAINGTRQFFSRVVPCVYSTRRYEYDHK